MSYLPNLKWNVNQNSIERIKKAYVKKSLEGVKDAIGDAASWGAKATLDYKVLGGTPTGSVWHYVTNVIRGNRDGARRDTGKMASAVGSSKATGNVIFSATYGLPKNGPEYFMQQEEGFTFTTWSGVKRKVPGMNDPRYGAQEKIDKAIEKQLRKKLLSKGFLPANGNVRFERVLNAMGRGQSFENAWSSEWGGNLQGYRQMVLNSGIRENMRQLIAEKAIYTTYDKILREQGASRAESWIKSIYG